MLVHTQTGSCHLRGVKFEIKKHIMDYGHERVRDTLQTSGTDIAVQRLVKGLR
jgi:hypothetical protein